MTDTNQIETHPFPPVLIPYATVLMMGTFPPTQEKWRMDFHYPNFHNDMWRIYALVFFNDAEHFMNTAKDAFEPERIKAFLAKKGIASCPTVRKAIREEGNASDKFLTVVEPVHLKQVVGELPKLGWIFTTGGKATEILLGKYDEFHGNEKPTKLPKSNSFIDFDIYDRDLKLFRLPSSSRAYPMKLEKKAACYKAFFEMAGLLPQKL